MLTGNGKHYNQQIASIRQNYHFQVWIFEHKWCARHVDMQNNNTHKYILIFFCGKKKLTNTTGVTYSSQVKFFVSLLPRGQLRKLWVQKDNASTECEYFLPKITQVASGLQRKFDEGYLLHLKTDFLSTWQVEVHYGWDFSSRFDREWPCLGETSTLTWLLYWRGKKKKHVFISDSVRDPLYRQGCQAIPSQSPSFMYN